MPAIRSRSSQSRSRAKLLFRSHLLLFGSLVLGLPFLIAFGEPGLWLCLMLYGLAMALVGRLLVREYRRTQSDPVLAQVRPPIEVVVLFAVDGAAAISVMFGIAVGSAAKSYGHQYVILGNMLVVVAAMIWLASLVWVLSRYRFSKNRAITVLVMFYFWFSVIGAVSVYFLVK